MNKIFALLRSYNYSRVLWVMLLGALCPIIATAEIWNNPYPASDSTANVTYGAFKERPKHLDPVRSYSANEYVFIGQIYEPPLQYHFLKRPVQLIPQALAIMPVITLFDAQGKQLPDDAPPATVAYSDYTLQFRPGMRYQPHPALAKDTMGQYVYHHLSPFQVAGVYTLADFPQTGTREVTAADYAYQITRLARPSLHCQIAGVLGQYILGFKTTSQALEAADLALTKKLGNNNPYLDLRSFHIEGVQVVDRYQLRIRLQGRYPQFSYWLAMPFFAPMPWEADLFYSQPGMDKRNISLDWYPIGSGPFMLTENNPNLRMVLERNPNFHAETYPDAGDTGDLTAKLLEDAGKPIPFIDKAIYSLELEDLPYWNKFLQGFYDSSGIASDSFDQAIRFNNQGEAGLTDIMRSRRIALDTEIVPSITYLGFNMLDSVVGGKSARATLLRRAIAIAINLEDYITIFANGRGIVAHSPIPPGIFGNRPEGYNAYVYDWVGSEPHRKPIEAAQALLAQAGYPHGRDHTTGKPLILYYDVVATGADDKADLNWMSKQFERLGIQLVIRATDYNRFMEKMRKGAAQIYRWGWNADYPDPENFLFMFYGPNSKVAHDGENASNYDNPEFNTMFEQMKNMANNLERQAIIDHMVDILRRDAPWAGGYHPKSFVLRHAWVHNAKPNPMANNTLKYLRIDAQQRAQLRAAWNPPITWPLWLLAIWGILITTIAYVNYWRREQRSAR